MNSDNPYQSPESPSGKTHTSEERDRLRRIGRSQRQVNLAVLLYLATIPVSMGISAIGADSAWAVLLLGFYVMVVIALGAFATYRLASVLRGPLVAVIYVLGLLVPLLGLLLLLYLNGKATKELRKAGIKIGLLGANIDSI